MQRESSSYCRVQSVRLKDSSMGTEKVRGVRVISELEKSSVGMTAFIDDDLLEANKTSRTLNLVVKDWCHQGWS